MTLPKLAREAILRNVKKRQKRRSAAVLFFPEMFHPTTFLHDASQLVCRGVARHDIESATGSRVLQRGIQGSFTFVNDTDLISRDFCVFQAHGNFFCFAATTDGIA